VIAEIEADKGAKLDDLVVAIVFTQLLNKGGIDRVGIDLHQLAVTQRDLLRFSEAPALGIMVDAFVEQLFR